MPDQIDIYSLKKLPFGFWYIEYFTGSIPLCFGFGKQRGKEVQRLLNAEHWNEITNTLEAETAPDSVTGTSSLNQQAETADAQERGGLKQKDESMTKTVKECIAWLCDAELYYFSHKKFYAATNEEQENDDKVIDIVKTIRAKLLAAENMAEALEKLARLGNGDQYGNSEGNIIAQQALEEWRKA